MKTTLSKLTLAAFCISLAWACSPAEPDEKSNPDSIVGKWTFRIKKDNQYAELWLGEKSLLTVVDQYPDPFLFDYEKIGDTIKMYDFGMMESDGPMVSHFVISERKEDSIFILQNGVNNSLAWVGPLPDTISQKKEFLEMVVTDFKSRNSTK